MIRSDPVQLEQKRLQAHPNESPLGLHSLLTPTNKWALWGSRGKGKGGIDRNNTFRGECTLPMLRAVWPPHSLTVVTWVDGQIDNVQTQEDACHGWPWLSSSHSKSEDAALVQEPGRNKYNEAPGTWAQFTGFCPLSPVTTVLIFPSSGMFLQQLKIVLKNVSQRKEKAKVTQCWLNHFVN